MVPPITTETHDVPIEINTGSSSVWAVTYTANSKYLVSGGNDGVQVWRVQDGRRVAAMAAGLVRCVAISRDGKWIAAGTHWGDVLVWDAMTCDKVLSRREDNHIIHGVDFAPDSTRLVVASENCSASIWEMVTRTRRRVLEHGTSVIAAKYALQGDRFATATETSVRVYDDDYHVLADISVQLTLYYNTGLVWSKDALLVSDYKIKCITFPFAGFEAVSDVLVPDTNYVLRGIALPQHSKFIACSTRRSVTFWDTSTREPTRIDEPIEYPRDIRSIALSPDDRFIAICGEGGKIIIASLPRIDIHASASTPVLGQRDEQPLTSDDHDDTQSSSRTGIEYPVLSTHGRLSPEARPASQLSIGASAANEDPLRASSIVSCDQSHHPVISSSINYPPIPPIQTVTPHAHAEVETSRQEP